jgi:hypothetical protein
MALLNSSLPGVIGAPASHFGDYFTGDLYFRVNPNDRFLLVKRAVPGDKDYLNRDGQTRL